MKSVKAFILLWALILASGGIFGEKLFPPLQAMVGMGGYVPFAGSIQRDKEGGDNKFHLNPYLTLHGLYPLKGDLFARPQFGWVFHRGTGDDYDKHTAFLLYHLAYFFHPTFLTNFGLGTFFTRISGKGEAVTLNNGNSTSTFYRPSETQISYNTTLDLGAEYVFEKQYSIGFDFYLFGLLSSVKRRMSYSLSVNYYL